jgi:hypothetical protein
MHRMLEIAARIFSVVALAVVLGRGSLATRVGVICLGTLVTVVGPWWSRRIGLPEQRADEAYITSLRRWRRTRRGIRDDADAP